MSAGAAEELDRLSERIARLVEHPDEVKSTFAALARPVMRALGWQPKLATQAAQVLGKRLQLSDAEAGLVGMPTVKVCARRALGELASNVTSVERACVVNGRMPFAYASWLWRLYQVVRRVHDWLAAPDDAFALRSALAVPPPDVFPPLVAKNAAGGVTQIAAIDPLIRAARDEIEVLGRRRRLLEAARTLLLDAAAALELDEEAKAARATYIAGEIARIDRLEGAGVAAEVGLVHQLRQALDRGQTQRLHAALIALEGFALQRGDGVLGKLTGRALDDLWGSESRFEPEMRAVSLLRSGREIMAQRVLEAMQKGIALGEKKARDLRYSEGKLARKEYEEWGLQLSCGGAEHSLAAALVADGSFEVGGALSPVRIADVRRTTRVVRFPTQHLVLANAHTIDDLPDAVIEDPRLVLVSLAAGKLLARRYLADEIEPTVRTGLAGEVRLYVLDGSTSMLGARGRMRDAILVAELSTLAARLADIRRKVRPTLYYRYFTDELDTLTVVEDEGEALIAIEQVLGTLRTGSTDIESALLASFERIRIARKEDPNLARAQIVLVTDGEAPIDEQKVLAAREALGSLPVGVSIIALGQENAALRALAARQRARGEAVFYQFTSDRELEELVMNANNALPLHLPKSREELDVSEVVREIVDEIEMRERKSDTDDMARAREELPALEELGLSLKEGLGQAELARAEALRRDERTLRRRFEHWFPAPAAKKRGDAPARAPVRRLPRVSDTALEQATWEDLELAATLLASVAEIVDLVGSEPLRRQVDAIEVFERLLSDAGLAPWRYAELLKAHPTEFADVLEAVRSSAVITDRPERPPRSSGT